MNEKGDLIRFPSSSRSSESQSSPHFPQSPQLTRKIVKSQTPTNTPILSEENSFEHEENDEIDENEEHEEIDENEEHEEIDENVGEEQNNQESSSFASLSSRSSSEHGAELNEINDKELLRVGIPSGKFQVSDVVACVIAKIKWGNIVTTRSNSENVLDSCDILFGIGGVYDPNGYRFDFHQNSCKETFDKGSQMLLSSAGMAWKYFGKDIVSDLIINLSGNTNSIHDDEMNQFIEHLHSTIYFKYILEIDANENGIPRLKEEIEPEETENYSFHINLPHIISKYNYDDTNNEFKQLEAFNKAMNTVGDIFETLCRQEVSYNLDFWRDINLFSREFDDPTNLPIAINVTRYKKTYGRLLDQLDPQREFVKFVYYNSGVDNSGADTWTVKARHIPDQPFVNVLDIPSDYRLRQLFKRDNNMLSDIAIQFVDKKGRFATASSKEIVKKIVDYAVEENNSGRKKTTRTSRKTLADIDKNDIKQIGKTALFATAMFGLGFLIAKNI